MLPPRLLPQGRKPRRAFIILRPCGKPAERASFPYTKRSFFAAGAAQLFFAEVKGIARHMRPARLCPPPALLRADGAHHARFALAAVSAARPAAQLFRFKQCKHGAARTRDGACLRRKGRRRRQCLRDARMQLTGGALQGVVHVCRHACKVAAGKRLGEAGAVAAGRVGRGVVPGEALRRGNAALRKKQQHVIGAGGCERLHGVSPAREAGEPAGKHVAGVAADGVGDAFELFFRPFALYAV